MSLSYLLLFIGLAILIKGAAWLVDGASSLARRFGVSALVVGLTVVAFGTSAPELVVNLLASLNGNTDLAIGNIIGSNIANILLILGIAAVIFPLKITKGTTWKEIPLALLAVVIVGIMANDALIDGASFSGLTRIDGLVLISFLFIFLYYIFSISKASDAAETEEHIRKHPLWISLLMIVGGIGAMVLGGKWVVDGAITLAEAFGISEAVIGLTVVAIGTSLPELATSAVAAFKKQADIAVGNVVGSNIFNVFWILGLSAVIRPLPFSPELGRDVLVAIFATLLLFIFTFVGRREHVDRWQGGGFIALYVIYMAFLFGI